MNERILIVEDNENLRSLYCQSLQELELNIHVAGDGIDAFKKIAQNAYDLYIVDIFLPGITGLEVIKVIKERYEKAKIVIISAAATDPIVKKAMELGVCGILKKPFRLNEIREIVRRFI